MGKYEVAIAVWVISSWVGLGAQADPMTERLTPSTAIADPNSSSSLSRLKSSAEPPRVETAQAPDSLLSPSTGQTTPTASPPDAALSPLKIGERQSPQGSSEVPPSTLYTHRMDAQEVVTVYLKDLPLISFVEHPELDPPLLRASSLVAQLNQLAQSPQQDYEISLRVEEQTQEPDPPWGHYSIQIDDQQLLSLDRGILLAGETSSTAVALTATNRLRRLLLQVPPLQTAPPLPQDLQPDPPAAATVVGAAEESTSGFKDEGYASWYGHGQHSHDLTAAHRKLPFGTKVRVTNLENGKATVVTINDRGPFLKGRVIDLSRAAAQTLDMIHSGVVPVQIEVVTP